MVWEESSRTLSFADNGIGMDADTILGKFLSLGDSGRVLLAANDLPDLRLSLNGEAVKPLFSRRGGTPISKAGAWGNGNTAVSRAYRRPPGQAGGAFYVRLGGLFQFAQSSTAHRSRYRALA